MPPTAQKMMICFTQHNSTIESIITIKADKNVSPISRIVHAFYISFGCKKEVEIYIYKTKVHLGTKKQMTANITGENIINTAFLRTCVRPKKSQEQKFLICSLRITMFFVLMRIENLKRYIIWITLYFFRNFASYQTFSHII